MTDFKRETAIKSVKKLLENLPNHHDYPKDAIRMIDREISGLLAHPSSPFCNEYRTYARSVFPSGLEATIPGHDIILILNKEIIIVKHHGKAHNISVPLALKNPEKGVAHIVGKDLALELFMFRSDVLIKLHEKNGEGWIVNCVANNEAIAVLNVYTPNQSIYPKKKPSAARQSMFVEQAKNNNASDTSDTPQVTSFLSRICPCIS